MNMSRAEEHARALNRWPPCTPYEMSQAAAHLRALDASHQRLVEALGFYANPGDYKAPFTGGLGKLWHDCGDTARAAIESAKALSEQVKS